MKKIFFIIIFITSINFANEFNENFISLEIKDDANQTLDIINNDILFKELQNKYFFQINLVPKDNKSFIILDNFNDDSVMSITHDIIKDKFLDIPII